MIVQLREGDYVREGGQSIGDKMIVQLREGDYVRVSSMLSEV